MTGFGKLVTEFREMCSQAVRGDKVTMIHLFGIRNAEHLKILSLRELSELAAQAGESPKYGTELRKMVRLSKYVEERR